MPYLTDWIKDRVEFTFDGQLRADEIEEAAQEIYNDPRFQQCRLQIFDFSNASLATVDFNDIQNYAMHDSYISNSILGNADCKIAIVSRDPHVHDLTEHYRSFSHTLNIQWDTQMFEDINSARAWGLNEPAYTAPTVELNKISKPIVALLP